MPEKEARKADVLPVHYNQGNYPAFLGQEELSELVHFRTLPHWHEEFEFLRVISGRMPHEINGVSVKLAEGDVLFVNVRQMHRSKRARENGKPVRCVFQILQFHPSALYGDILLARSTVLPLMKNRKFSHLHIPSDHPEIRVWHELLDLCFRFAADGEVGRDLALTGAMYMLLSLLRKEYSRGVRETEGVQDRAELLDVRRMLSFIFQNYARKIGLQEIAGVIPTSRSRCTRLFRKYMDHTPAEFLNLYRLQTAAEKLLETGDPIADIAAACGFSDQSYFGKAFQKVYRMSPGKYRALQKRQPSVLPHDLRES